jgi:DNA helicase-2/ATP-dependent DNA helicase PcrA
MPSHDPFSSSHLVESLTPAQRQAVEHLDGPQLILAGPGSGKTRVVTHRIANLLFHGVSARQIVALTFTNKAADEMKARVAQLAPGHPVWISTFHRFCARLLRQYAAMVGLEENFSIYDTGDSNRLLRAVMEEMQLDTSHFTPERVASVISGAKNKCVGPEEFAARGGSPIGGIVAKIYPRYQSRLLSANAVDFDDLLMHVAVLLRVNPEIRSALDERFRYLLVDEYQDTNLVQYAIVRALAQDFPNLSVTGDPDQSIYGWRGAHLGNILDFEKDYSNVQVVRLEQNYRSTKRILKVADALIANNLRRKAKSLFTDNAEGSPVRLVSYPTHRDEAEQIASRIAAEVRSGRRRPSDFAVFYRINALSRELELALRMQGVPFQLVNSLEFFQRREIKDVMAYLHLVNNPRSDVALLRVINMPPRGIGKTTIERIAEHARRGAMPLLTAARECGLVESLNKRAAVAVAKFVAMYDRLGEQAHGSVENLLGHVLAESGYEQYLQQSDDAADEDRLANIQELLTAAREFDEDFSGDSALEAFLEQTSLVNDTDSFEGDTDKVSLMTIHSAKGLEFTAIFVIAVEEGILPHERGRADLAELEEERRLLFVAMTRAREELQLSLAKYRDFRGQRRMTVPSTFLMELPRDEMELVDLQLAASHYVPEPDDEPHDAGDLDDEDVSFDPSEFAAPAGEVRLTTAAELAASAIETQIDSAVATQPARFPPDGFQEGMLVRHPEYGLGKIMAVTGFGPRRTATVNFVTGAGQKKFVLEKSALRPAR